MNRKPRDEFSNLVGAFSNSKDSYAGIENKLNYTGELEKFFRKLEKFYERHTSIESSDERR